MRSVTRNWASWRRAIACLGALPFCLGLGPCGPIPGGRLPDTSTSIAVAEWSFANTVPNCSVEVRPEDPYSITVNCMSFDSDLFVSCSVCASKRWAKMAMADPRVRVKVGERVFPAHIKRVTEPARLDAVWRARARKLGKDPNDPRPESWWTFQLYSPPPPPSPSTRS